LREQDRAHHRFIVGGRIMTLGKLAASRIARTAVLGVAVVLAVACTQEIPFRTAGNHDSAAGITRDPVERMLLESERKKALARELAGGESVPRDGGKRDASISDKAVTALSAERSLRAAEIHVRTRASVVTLDGSADTPQSRDKAAQVVLNVQGVRSVRNEIRIDEGS
jgi:hypothetical protein